MPLFFHRHSANHFEACVVTQPMFNVRLVGQSVGSVNSMHTLESTARTRPTVFVEKDLFQKASGYRRRLHQRNVARSALYTLQPLLNPSIF
jgi:hypothetical protein